MCFRQIPVSLICPVAKTGDSGPSAESSTSSASFYPDSDLP